MCKLCECNDLKDEFDSVDLSEKELDFGILNGDTSVRETRLAMFRNKDCYEIAAVVQVGDESVWASQKIHYCPVCGRKL